MKKHSGFSLVELMIAMIIAMIVLLVVSQIYVGGLRTQRAQTEVLRLNESARFAFDLITRELRKAGHRNLWQLGSTAKDFCSVSGLAEANPALIGLNDPATLNPATTTSNWTTLAPLTNIYSPAVGRYNDVIRVRYYGENVTSTSPVHDCHGYDVLENVLVEDTLYVAVDAANNNEPTLYCHTSNPNPARGTAPATLPLVAGVESMQFLYGEDTDTEVDGIVNRYVPWHLLGSASPDRLNSVKVSILVRSANAVSNDGATVGRGPLVHFGAGYSGVAATNTDDSALFPSAGTDVPNDGRKRLLLSTDVNLRNLNYCD
jgi:type IV pilus assembly protein PilW